MAGQKVTIINAQGKTANIDAEEFARTYDVNKTQHPDYKVRMYDSSGNAKDVAVGEAIGLFRSKKYGYWKGQVTGTKNSDVKDDSNPNTASKSTAERAKEVASKSKEKRDAAWTTAMEGMNKSKEAEKKTGTAKAGAAVSGGSSTSRRIEDGGGFLNQQISQNTIGASKPVSSNGNVVNPVKAPQMPVYNNPFSDDKQYEQNVKQYDEVVAKNKRGEFLTPMEKNILAQGKPTESIAKTVTETAKKNKDTYDERKKVKTRLTTDENGNTSMQMRDDLTDMERSARVVNADIKGSDTASNAVNPFVDALMQKQFQFAENELKRNTNILDGQAQFTSNMAQFNGRIAPETIKSLISDDKFLNETLYPAVENSILDYDSNGNKYIKESIVKDAEEYGMSVNDYIQNHIFGNIVAKAFDKVDYNEDKKNEIHNMGEYLIAKLNNSFLGQLQGMSMMSKEQRQSKARALGKYEEENNDGTLKGLGKMIAGEFTTAFADAPLFEGAGFVGKGAAKLMGLAFKGTAEKLAGTAVGRFFSTMANKAASSTALGLAERRIAAQMPLIMQGVRYVGRTAPSSMANMGTFMGAKGAMNVAYAGNETGNNSFGAILQGFGEGFKEGAEFGLTMSLTGAPIATFAAKYAGTPLERMALGFTGKSVELGSMIGLDWVKQGDQFDFTHSFSGALSVIIGMHYGAKMAKPSVGGAIKGAVDTAKAIRHPWQTARAKWNAMTSGKANVEYKLSNEEIEQLKQVYDGDIYDLGDFDVKKQMKMVRFGDQMIPARDENNEVIYEYTDLDGNVLGNVKDGDPELQALYNKMSSIFNNDGISYEIKQKIGANMFGTIEPYRPLYDHYNLENGRMKLFSKDGTLIAERKYTNSDDILAIEMTEKQRYNADYTKNALGELMLNEKYDEVNQITGDIAKRFDVDEKQISKILNKKPGTLSEKEINIVKAYATELDNARLNSISGENATNVASSIGANYASNVNLAEQPNPNFVQWLYDDMVAKKAKVEAYGENITTEAKEVDILLKNGTINQKQADAMLQQVRDYNDYMNAEARYNAFKEKTAENIRQAAEMEWQSTSNGDLGRISARDANGEYFVISDISSSDGVVTEGKTLTSDSGMAIVVDKATGEIKYIKPEELVCTGVEAKDEFMNARVAELQEKISAESFGAESNAVDAPLNGDVDNNGNGVADVPGIEESRKAVEKLINEKEGLDDYVGDADSMNLDDIQMALDGGVITEDEADILRGYVALRDGNSQPNTADVPVVDEDNNPSIVVDENGEKLYRKSGISVEDAYDDIVKDLDGDEDMAVDIAKAKAEAARKAADKLRNKKVSTNVAEMKQRKEDIKEYDADAEYWDKVAGEKKRRADAEMLDIANGKKNIFGEEVDPDREGNSQILSSLRKIAEIIGTDVEKINDDNAIDVANEVYKLVKNIKNGADVTDTEKNFAKDVVGKIESLGYEFGELEVGDAYKEDMNYNATFELDESLSNGESIISRIDKPLMLKDGKMVQAPDVVVRYNNEEKPNSPVVFTDAPDGVPEGEKQAFLDKANNYRANKTDGKESFFYLPNGERVKGRYVLHEAEDTMPSHDPLNGFKQTEGVPRKADGRTNNDRDYESDKDAQMTTKGQAQVFRMSNDLPVVSEHGVTLSGNGRDQAGKLAAKNGTDTRYAEDLKTKKEEFGFTDEDLAKYKHPRVSFEIEGEVEYDTKTYAKFNENEKKRMNSTESAVKFGKILEESPAQVMAIADEVSKYDRVADLYDNIKSTRKVFEALVRAGVWSDGDRVNYLDADGYFTRIGELEFENVLRGLCFTDEAIQLLDKGSMKAISRAMLKAMPHIVENNHLGEYSIMRLVEASLKTIYQAIENGDYKNGDILSYFLKVDMGGEMAGQRVLDAKDINGNPLFTDEEKALCVLISHALAKAKNTNTPKFLINMLEEYNKIASEYVDRDEYGNLLPKNTLFGDNPTAESMVKLQSDDAIKELDRIINDKKAKENEREEARNLKRAIEAITSKHNDESIQESPIGGGKGKPRDPLDPEASNEDVPDSEEYERNSPEEAAKFKADHPLTEADIDKYAVDEDMADDAKDFLNGEHNDFTRSAYMDVYDRKMADPNKANEPRKYPHGSMEVEVTDEDVSNAESYFESVDQSKRTRSELQRKMKWGYYKANDVIEELKAKRPDLFESNDDNGPQDPPSAGGATGGVGDATPNVKPNTPNKKPNEEPKTPKGSGTGGGKKRSEGWKTAADDFDNALDGLLSKDERLMSIISDGRVDNDPKVRAAFKLISEKATALGYEMIKGGIYDKEEWKDDFTEQFGDKAKRVMEMDDNEWSDFLDDIWSNKKHRDGERLTLEQWAKKYKEQYGNDEIVPSDGAADEADGNNENEGDGNGGDSEGHPDAEPGDQSPTGGGTTGGFGEYPSDGFGPDDATEPDGTPEPSGDGGNGGRDDVSGLPGGATSGSNNGSGGGATGGKKPATPEGTSDGIRDVPESDAVSEGGNNSIDDKVKIDSEKVAYKAKSKGKSLNSVVPAGLNDAMAKNLNEIGDVDEYVREALGYKSVDELHQGLAAEQVDGVALAVKAMRNGYAPIIADQTGLGKGRQAASLLRYAMKQGLKPVFFTEKASLFTDLYRDMVDTGNGDKIPFIIASDAKNGQIVHEDTVIGLPSEEEVAYFMKTGKLPKGYDYAVCTYSQIFETNGDKEGVDDSIDSVDNKNLNLAGRRKAVADLCKNNVVIFDEAHNAAGAQSSSGRYCKQIVRDARGVSFFSATYAKKPDNMALYAMRSVISDANIAEDEMIRAIDKGGAAYQEVLARELAESGALIRRERNMEGVTVDWEKSKIGEEEQRATYDKAISTFKEISELQKRLAKLVEKYVKSQYGPNATVVYTKNRSRLFNVTNQLFMALKVEDAIARSIEILKGEEEIEVNGEKRKVKGKVFIPLHNTNDAFLNQFFNEGEEVTKNDMSNLLLGCLNKSMQFKVYSDKLDGMPISAEDVVDILGSDLRIEIDNIRENIEDMTLGLPMSPIDALIDGFEKAGFKAGEITGRKSYIKMNEEGKLINTKRERPKNNDVVKAYNDGDLDVVIVNDSGSTGLSMHASDKFKDQRKRYCVTLQAMLDVNTEMQIRGRVDRTGQLYHAAYSYLVSHIPAENRLMMMLKTKLKSLDAQTTASQKSTFNEVDTADFANKYGSQVIVELMKEDPRWADLMDDPLGWNNSKDKTPEEARDSYTPKEKDYDKVMKRVAEMTCDEQEEFYDLVVERYASKIAELTATGMNDLEITNVPLDAEIKNSGEVIRGEAPGGSNVFADSTYIDEVEANNLDKPMTKAELENAVRAGLDGKTSDVISKEKMDEIDAWADSEIKKVEESAKQRYETRVTRYVDKMKEKAEKDGKTINWNDPNDPYVKKIETEKMIQQDAMDETIDNAKKKIADTTGQFREVFKRFKIGEYVTSYRNMGNGSMAQFEGVVVGFDISKGRKATASYINIASSRGQKLIRIPFADKYALTHVGMNIMQNPDWEHPVENWDKIARHGHDKEIRYIYTGNIMNALVQGRRGQLINYTTSDGQVQLGMLLPKGTSLGDIGRRRPFVEAYDTVKDFWKADKGEIKTSDRRFTIKFVKQRGWYSDNSHWELRFPKNGKTKDILADRGLAEASGQIFDADATEFFGDHKSNAILKIYDEYRLRDVMQYLTDNYKSEFDDAIDWSKNQTEMNIQGITRGNNYSADSAREHFRQLISGLEDFDNDVAELAENVFDVVSALGIKIQYGRASSDKAVMGYFDPSKREIRYKWNHIMYGSKKTAAETMLHEMIHGVTSYAIIARKRGKPMSKELQEAVDEIIEIQDLINNDKEFAPQIKIHPYSKEWYGAYNYKGAMKGHEAVAEMANPIWRAKLKAMNLWERWKNAVGNVVKALWADAGLPAKDQTAFDRMDKALKKMLDNFDKDLFDEVIGEGDWDGEEGGLARILDEKDSYDKKEIDRLESLGKDELVEVYRSMQIVEIDGKRYLVPPMSGKVEGDWQDPIEIDKNNNIINNKLWIRSDERPWLANFTVPTATGKSTTHIPVDECRQNENGEWLYRSLKTGEWTKVPNQQPVFYLDKNGNKKDGIWAAYNPYGHYATGMLNDQFSSAQDRDNLVSVKFVIPKSELNGEYKAQYAKDSTGEIPNWKAGIVTGQLTGTRGVILSRWGKPVQIVTNKEVADNIYEVVKDQDIIFPSNVVPKDVRANLEANGIKFVETDNQGILKEGKHKGDHYSMWYSNNPSKDSIKKWTKKTGLMWSEMEKERNKMRSEALGRGEKADHFEEGIRYSEGDNTRSASVGMPYDEFEDMANPVIGAARDQRIQERLNSREQKVRDAYKKLIGPFKFEKDIRQMYGDDNYEHARDYVDQALKPYIDSIKKDFMQMLNPDTWNLPYSLDFLRKKGAEMDKAIRDIENSVDRLKPDWSVDEENDENYERLSKAQAIDNVLNDMHTKLSNLLERYYEYYNTKMEAADNRISFREGDSATSRGTQDSVEVRAKVAQGAIDSLGGKGRVHTSVDTIKDGRVRRDINNGRNIKGWYDTETGEVHIFAPNCESEKDAERTVMHEKVGHEGLRGLLGEKFNGFLHKVFRGLSADARKAIIADAGNNGWNFDEALDEYLAKAAEDFSDTGRSVIKRVKDVLNDVLRGLGWKKTCTEDDVRTALWLSKNKLENKTGSVEYRIRKAAFESKLKRYPAEEKMSEDGQKFVDDYPIYTDENSMELYQGSGADFDKHSNDYALSGEGSMVYGYGQYFSNVKGTGEIYANIAAANKLNGVEKVEFVGDKKGFNDNVIKQVGSWIAEKGYDDVKTFLEQHPATTEKQQEIQDFFSSTSKTDWKSNLEGKRYLYTTRVPKDNSIAIEEKENEFNERIRPILRNLIRTKHLTDDSLFEKGLIEMANRYGEDYVSQFEYRNDKWRLKDDSDINYLPWIDRLSDNSLSSLVDKCVAEMRKQGVSEDETKRFEDWKRNKGNAYIEKIYNDLSRIVGGDKNASNLLSKVGYIGIKVPTGARRGGDGRGFNYVIFNPDKHTNIKSKLRFSTGGGVTTPTGHNERAIYERAIKKWTYLWKEAHRYASGTPTPSGYSARAKYEDELKKVGYLYNEGHHNNLASLEILQKAIVGEHGTVKDTNNAFWKLNALGSKDEQAQEQYMREICKPIDHIVKKSMAKFSGKKAKERYQQFEDYLYAKHGLERNRVFKVRDHIKKLMESTDSNDIAEAQRLQSAFDTLKNVLKRNLDQKRITLAEYFDKIDDFIIDEIDDKYTAGGVDYSGMSDKKRFSWGNGDGTYNDADAIMHVMNCETTMGDELVSNTYRAINNASDFSLEMQYQSGLIGKKDIESARSMFNWYVPLRNYDEKTAEETYSYVGSHEGLGNMGLMRASGRWSAAKMPLATLMAMGNSNILQGNRNIAKQALLRLVRENPSDLVTEMKLMCVKTVDQYGNDIYTPIYPKLKEGMTGDEVDQALKDYEADIEARKAAGEDIVSVNKRKGDIELKFEYKKNLTEHFINVKVGGKIHTLVINSHPRAAQAVNGMLRDGHFGWAGKYFFKPVNNLMSQLATSYSATFMARNALRDIEFAYTTLSAVEGMKYSSKFMVNYGMLTGMSLVNLPSSALSIATKPTTLAVNKISGKEFENPLHKIQINSMRVMFRKYKDRKLDMNNETEKYFKEFADNGGITGYVQMADIDKWQKHIDRIAKDGVFDTSKGFRKARHLTGDALGTVFGGYFNTIKAVNEAIENQARFAAYMTSRQQKRTIARSIQDAKNVSVNFNLTGSGSSVWSMKFGNESSWHLFNRVLSGASATFMKNTAIFYNAGVQGMVRAYNVVKGGDWKQTTKAVSGIVVAPFIWGLMADGLNAMIASSCDDDDDRKKFGDDPYAQLPEYERRQNMCMYLGHGRWLKIPVAIELRAFMGLGDLAYGSHNRNLRPIGVVDPENGQGWEYTGEVLKELAQITPVDIFGGSKVARNDFWGGVLGVVTPTVAQTPIALVSNVGWTGTPVSRAAYYNENDPNYTKANARTGKGFIEVSHWLNNLWDGDDVTPGKINLNPSKMEYMLKQYGGGPMKDILEVWEAVSDDEKLFEHNLPVGKAFYRPSTADNSMNVAKTRYYNYVKEAKVTNDHISGYKKLKDVDNQAKYKALESSPAGARAKIMKKFESEVKKVQTKMRSVSSVSDRLALQEELNSLMSRCVETMDLIEENRQKGYEGKKLLEGVKKHK